MTRLGIGYVVEIACPKACNVVSCYLVKLLGSVLHGSSLVSPVDQSTPVIFKFGLIVRPIELPQVIP